MVSASSRSDVELFILSGREAPELQELTHLPSEVHLLGTGRPDVELKGTNSSLCCRIVPGRRCMPQHAYVPLLKAACRLDKVGLGESASAFEMWNR